MAVKANRRGLLTLLAAPPLMAGFMAIIWSTEIATEWENVTVDQRFSTRAVSVPPHDERIVLAGIGEQSLRQVGRWEEWSRRVHSQFLDAATYRPPKIVAYDFFFSEKSIYDEEGDFVFADSLALFPSAVTGMRIELDEDEPKPLNTYMGATEPITNITGDLTQLIGGNEGSVPYEYLADSTWTGSINCPTSDADNMRRFMPIVARLGENVYPSFVLQILMRLEEASPEDVEVILYVSIVCE